jgi:hypothetical protein
VSNFLVLKDFCARDSYGDKLRNLQVQVNRIYYVEYCEHNGWFFYWFFVSTSLESPHKSVSLFSYLEPEKVNMHFQWKVEAFFLGGDCGG